MSSAGVSASSATPSTRRTSGESGIDLSRAREDAAALRDERLVVVLPRRARQREQPLALRGSSSPGPDPGRGRCGGGRRRRRSRMWRDSSMPLPNTSPGHVADAGDGEVLRLRVDAHLAEVALHALPGAARRDAHLLVVVAGAAARGEGVAQPVAVFRAHRVGVVGEGRRALVGGHHEVRVVRVVAHHVLRRHDLAALQVVGDVEEPAQEVLVAGDAFLQVRLALGGRRAPP